MYLTGAFEDPDIIHVDDAVDPVRDLETITEELRLKVLLNLYYIMHDMCDMCTIITSIYPLLIKTSVLHLIENKINNAKIKGLRCHLNVSCFFFPGVCTASI